MAADQPSGFYGAPVTKALTMISVGCSVGLVALDAQPQALLSFSHLARLQWWRMLTVNTAFAGNAEIIIGAVLLYTCRGIERQLGSRKFGAFVALVAVLSTWVHVGALIVCHTGLVPRHLAPPIIFAPGPYAVIYGLLALFHAMIPKLRPAMFSVLGLRFSDKSFTYLLALQLIGSAGARSAAPALLGVTLGRLYVGKGATGAALQRLRLPAFVEGILGTAFPLFASDPPGEGQRRRARALELRRQQRLNAGGLGGGAHGAGIGAGQRQEEMWEQLPANAGGGMPQQGFAAAPPPPEAIETLTSMGFSREQVVQALAVTDNNVEAAANRLLAG